ncbi:hypothetical protein BRADI_5g26385v3 [Brachypodium distachyon]|uniref:TF-B3 domain-containing protein n=1 Tax=Brachypodium distachyon TaxID=15368 RepID=A0A2K2CJF3_BRADI|nr:hypothetical protein BRADI_5g26385v3 [Brachypodium distachyon]
MQEYQVRHLECLIGTKSPQFRYYVCTMNKPFVSPRQRMYLDHTEYLLPYLDPAVNHLRIKLAGTSIAHRVHLMKGTDGRATITTNWQNFVHDAGLQEGDIVAFVFSARRTKLCLHV